METCHQVVISVSLVLTTTTTCNDTDVSGECLVLTGPTCGTCHQVEINAYPHHHQLTVNKEI